MPSSSRTSRPRVPDGGHVVGPVVADAPVPVSGEMDAILVTGEVADNVDDIPNADTCFNMDSNENGANVDPNVATTALTALTADDAHVVNVENVEVKDAPRVDQQGITVVATIAADHVCEMDATTWARSRSGT